MKNLTTRTRIALLVIAAALPALGLSVYTGLQRRIDAEAGAREDLERFAVLAVRQEEQTIEGIRQFLLAVAHPAKSLIGTPQACTRFFSGLTAASAGRYHSIGIHSAEGRLICNSVTWTAKVDVNNRRYFRLAADQRAFSVGGHQAGRATGLGGVNFGYPVIGEDGALAGVVFAALNLEKLNQVTATTPMPAGGMLTIFDHEGTILARNPGTAGRVGEKARNPAIIEAIEAGEDREFDALDTQGVQRMFAFKTIWTNPDGKAALHVLVSIPKDVILANANRALMLTVMGIVTATVLLLLAGWHGAKFVVLDKIETMLKVTRRVHDGDLTVRTGFQPGKEELSRLGIALDEMAQSLQNRDTQLKDALRQLGEQAATDSLTGLYNRRYLWDFLERELLKARRSGTSIAVIMLDIDYFKQFNDTWGHEAGDLVLRSMADAMRRCIRGSDVACRFGGEEFVVALPGATREVAVARAEEIRREIETMRPSHRGSPLGTITATLGVALYPEHARDAESLVREADDLLYVAKNLGRNRVMVREANAPAGPGA